MTKTRRKSNAIATTAATEAASGATEAASGAVLFIPLDKLKKSPRNARKTAHGAAHIEALAASIAAKGMLQNLVVEPETDETGTPTGCYFVTIGEGRRLAQEFRAGRGEIGADEPIRCVLDTVNDAHEISLDENVTREAMHPADQFEAFRRLAQEKGWGAEEIAARFGVTPHAVKQRLRLGAVSPRLMQAYRDGGLTLEQLMAFAITENHQRQEQIFKSLSHNREPRYIRRELMENHIPAGDRRAVFIGAEAYRQAGGVIVRDLFDDDYGGYYEDVGLLDRMVSDRLRALAENIRETEGWKWCEAHLDFPHGHGLRRVFAHEVELSEEDNVAYDAAQQEYDTLSEQYADADELPEDADRRCAELEAEMERIDRLRRAYDPEDVARGGVFVSLTYDGEPRFERGFIRAEDELPKPEQPVNEETPVSEEGEPASEELDQPDDEEEEDGDSSMPLSHSLIRDLSAHRTLGLRLALGEQPDMALNAVIHTLAAQTFYRGREEAHCLELRPSSVSLFPHADGIEDTVAAKALSDRHKAWAASLPREVDDLWPFIAAMDHDSRMGLLAHCASLTVNALKLSWDRNLHPALTVERLASALSLDMSTHWQPTVHGYLGRVTKAHILAAVEEALGKDAAERLTDKKKQEMAEAAEALLIGSGWLPASLRTQPAAELEETPEPALVAAE